MRPFPMNEWEANFERLAMTGRQLDDAILDAINARPPEERPAMCDRLRSLLTDLPRFRVVDGIAEKVDGDWQ